MHFDSKGLTVSLLASIQVFDLLNSEFPSSWRSWKLFELNNKQESSAKSFGVVCNAFTMSLT